MTIPLRFVFTLDRFAGAVPSAVSIFVDLDGDWTPAPDEVVRMEGGPLEFTGTFELPRETTEGLWIAVAYRAPGGLRWTLSVTRQDQGRQVCSGAGVAQMRDAFWASCGP